MVDDSVKKSVSFQGKKAKHVASILVLVTLVASVAVLVIGYTNKKKATDIALWVEIENRPDLLESLLGSKPQFRGSYGLNPSSPIYNRNQSDIIALIGPPDDQNQVSLAYELGNVTLNEFENVISGQNAVLYLYFTGSYCDRYQIME